MRKTHKNINRLPMTHIVITRMLYKSGFEERLKFFKKTLLPSLAKQKNQNFDIGVLCAPEHKKQVEDLGLIAFHRKDGSYGKKRGKYWGSRAKWDDITLEKKYDIQSNIDSDDEVSEDYIDIVQKHCVGKRSIHIHFHPVLVDWKTKEEKLIRKKHGPERGSAFYSLYQPYKKNYIYIGQDSHRNMPKYADKTILIQGHTWVNVHDNNDSTTLKS